MADARQYMIWAFKLRGCVDCGFTPQTKEDLAKLDCDHRDPSTKFHFEGRGMKRQNGIDRGASNMDGLLRELFKCDPVCKPCHVQRGRARRRPGQLELSDAMRAWQAEPVPDVGPGEQLTI